MCELLQSLRLLSFNAFSQASFGSNLWTHYVKSNSTEVYFQQGIGPFHLNNLDKKTNPENSRSSGRKLTTEPRLRVSVISGVVLR